MGADLYMNPPEEPEISLGQRVVNMEQENKVLRRDLANMAAENKLLKQEIEELRNRLFNIIMQG